jgi:hypothetical protein
MRLVPILFLLGACAAPGPYFRGLPVVQVNVNGSTFDVRVRDGLGEAIRTNTQYAPRLGLLEGKARAAIELASGCRVEKIKGDQAQTLATLDCGSGAPRWATPAARDFDCLVTDRYVRPSTDEEVLELDCRPI